MNNLLLKTYYVIAALSFCAGADASLPSTDPYAVPPAYAASAQYAPSAPPFEACNNENVYPSGPSAVPIYPTLENQPLASAPPLEKLRKVGTRVSPALGFNPYAEIISGFAIGVLMCGEIDHPKTVDKKFLTWRRACYIPAIIGWQLFCSKFYPERAWAIETGLFWGTGWVCGFLCKHPEALELALKVITTTSRVAKNAAKAEAYRREREALPT